MAAYWFEQGEWRCECGHSIPQNPKFLDHFFAPDICPSCGETKMPRICPWRARTWKERHTFTGKWYLPWTWNNVRVETKDEYEREAW